MSVFLDFADKTVSYDTFVNDVARRIADVLSEREADPEYVTQNTAYRIFGRANVERWRRDLRITPLRRPGKLEYSTKQLRMLQQKEV